MKINQNKDASMAAMIKKERSPKCYVLYILKAQFISPPLEFSKSEK